MTIQELIYNTLIQYEQLTAIVGTRIFPVRLPRDVVLPAIVYQIRSSEGVNSITSGDSGLDRVLVTISVWSNSYSQSQTIAGIVREALATSGLRVTTESVSDSEDLETRSYNVDINFRIWSASNIGTPPTPDEAVSRWEEDGDSHIKPKKSKKVFVVNIDGAVEEALIDGKQYARKDGGWVEVQSPDMSEYAKLDGAEFTGNISAQNLSGDNTGDETASGIKDKLETLEDDDRLDASAIKNIPEPDLSGYAKKTDSKDITISGDLSGLYSRGILVWEIPFKDIGYGITINSIVVRSSENDPTTELTAGIYRCDAVTTGAFPGGNQTLVKTINTTTGNFSWSGTENIDTTKLLYLQLNADPVDIGTVWTIKINYITKAS